MRNTIAILAAVGMSMIIPSAPALADGATIGDGICAGFVPDGSGGLTDILVFSTYSSRTTKSGITNFSCHFDLNADQAPSKGAKAQGFECVTPYGPATETRVQASPGGRMVMTCSIKTGG